MSDPAALIADLDQDLALIRDSMASATPDKKPRWQRLIDNALDERLRLMALRDKAASGRRPARATGV